MDGKVTIYALCDETGMRYIGQTCQPVKLRAYQHRFDLTTGGAAKIAWIKSMRAAGQKPRLEVLEVVARADAAEAERRHIALARERGCPLLNVRPGGERGRQPTDERDIVRIALRLPDDRHAALTSASEAGGWSMHAEILQRLRAAGKGRKRSAHAAAQPKREP